MLSKKAQELLDLLTGKKVTTKTIGNREQFWISRPVENALKEGTITFVKSMTEKPTVARALAARGTIAHVAKVGGSADLDRGFEKLAKRAPHVPITEAEMQGGTPSVGKLPGDRTTPGLGDSGTDTARFLVGLTPAEITRLMLEEYATIRENMGRRITAEE